MISQFFLTGFSHIVPLLLIPFLVSTIGIERYGVLALAVSVGGYFLSVFDWGFSLSNVRPVIAANRDPRELSQVISRTFYSKLILIILLFVPYLLLVSYIPLLFNYRGLLLLTYFWIIGYTSNLNWLYRALEEMKLVTQITLVAKVLAISPIFLVVRDDRDYIWVMGFYSLEAWMGTLFSWWIAWRRYGCTLLRPDIRKIIATIKSSFPFFISSFLVRLYQNSGVLVIGIACGEAAAGLYSVAEKLHNAYASFIVPLIMHVLYPYFSRTRDAVRMRKGLLWSTGSNALLLLLIGLSSFVLLPLVFPDVAHEVRAPFLLFLGVLFITIPSEFLGFPTMGVLFGTKSVIHTTVLASFAYLVAISFLYFCDLVSVYTVICVLIVTNSVTLLLRFMKMRHILWQ